MGKARKKIFPKKPIPFHSGLAHQLGKHSNFSPEANLRAIYNTPTPEKPSLTEAQAKTLKALLKTIKESL